MASGDSSASVPPEKKHKLFLSDKEETDGHEFPDTLEGFGYHFTDGKLRHIETGGTFEFEVREGDHEYNQRRYEALGEVITDHVYDLLQSEGKLKKKYIPVDASDDEPCTFVFHSEDAFTNSKLLVLIHGSGVVRAGQWSRRLIINDCLDSGTQLPFIKEARELGYGIIVLNTNDNHRLINGKKRSIRGSENPSVHTLYVWKHLISEAAAEHIAIIAHSYGGVVTVNLCKSVLKELDEKVFAIAFTDSVHSLESQGMGSSARIFLRKVCRNWVSNDSPLDSPVERCTSGEIECVSAGTDKHELTSWSSITSIFQFIEERLKKRLREDL